MEEFTTALPSPKSQESAVAGLLLSPESFIGIDWFIGALQAPLNWLNVAGLPKLIAGA